MSSPGRLGFGDFVLERSQRRLLRSDGSELSLTPRVFAALVLLVEHPGELLDKDTLIRGIWPGLVVEENNLSQVISALRRALGDDAHGSRFIQTVPRRGFRFIAAVSPLPDDSEPPASLAGHRTGAAAQPAVPAEPPGPGSRTALARLINRRGRRQVIAAAVATGLSAASAALLGWKWRDNGWRTGEPDGVTVAVLPFKPLTAESSDRLLEIGMADSLVARLSLVPGLIVRSTGSVLRYAGASQDPLLAGRELDVTWVVDGTLQRQGDALRVTARLLRVADGTAAWSGSFDEKYVDVFAVQDQISNRVAGALADRLRRNRSIAKPIADFGGTHDTDAYRLYLAAAWRIKGWGPADVGRGIELLQEALRIDPSYAQAWALLGRAHRHTLWRFDTVPAEVFKAAEVAIQRALALTPELAQARAGLGFRRYWFDFDWSGAEAEFRRALAANPNEVSTRWGLAQLLLATQGRIDEGFFHMRQARELDPGSPLLNTLEASFLVAAGQIAEARKRLDRTFALAPDHGLALIALGMLHMAEKQPDQAIEALRRAVEVTGGSSRAKAVLSVYLAERGRADEARAIRDELLQRASARFVPPTLLAMIHAALGQTEPAMAGLQQAVALRDTRVIYLKDDPNWARLRGDPRFHAIIRTLGVDRFPPALTPV